MFGNASDNLQQILGHQRFTVSSEKNRVNAESRSLMDQVDVFRCSQCVAVIASSPLCGPAVDAIVVAHVGEPESENKNACSAKVRFESRHRDVVEAYQQSSRVSYAIQNIFHVRVDQQAAQKRRTLISRSRRAVQAHLHRLDLMQVGHRILRIDQTLAACSRSFATLTPP